MHWFSIRLLGFLLPGRCPSHPLFSESRFRFLLVGAPTKTSEGGSLATARESGEPQRLPGAGLRPGEVGLQDLPRAAAEARGRTGFIQVKL